jgi:hypothetical protein
MTALSTHPDLAADTALGQARGCHCTTPFRDEDTCLLCGRHVPALVNPGPRTRRSPHDGNPWTPAGVVRALRTYEFFVGRPPTDKDWSFEDDRSWPSVRTVLRTFGSFEAAVGAARELPGRGIA